MGEPIHIEETEAKEEPTAMGSCATDKSTPEGSRNHMLQDSKEEGCSKGSDSRRLDLMWEGREGAMSMDVRPNKQGGSGRKASRRNEPFKTRSRPRANK